MIYYTHNNGGRPYKVDIRDEEVKIYNNYEIKNPDKPIVAFKPSKVFIGESPECYAEKYDGNTILLEIGENEYIYIGECITKFKTLSKVIYYLSPVGNNDVPYPFAIDEKGNFYLIAEDIILLAEGGHVAGIKETEDCDPYEYYYHKSKIGRDFDRRVYVGENKYWFGFHDDSEEIYDRLTKNSTLDLYIGRETKAKKLVIKGDMYIENEKGEKIPCNNLEINGEEFSFSNPSERIKYTKEEYVQLMKDIAKEKGIKKLEFVTLKKRGEF